jgi:bacterioferritin-associated ferredoxin
MDMDENEVLICSCNEIYKSEIVEAVAEKGLRSVEEVGDETTAGTSCGQCQDDIPAVLDEIYRR